MMIMEVTKRRSVIDLILKILIMFMILFVSTIVMISIIYREFDMRGIIVGAAFIFFLIFLKWMIREIDM